MVPVYIVFSVQNNSYKMPAAVFVWNKREWVHNTGWHN